MPLEMLDTIGTLIPKGLKEKPGLRKPGSQKS